jgi:membrane protein DedA with SNARE-associated domain
MSLSTLSISQTVVELIRDYSFWAGPAAFATSLAASAPAFNFFIPAGLILVAAGVLVGAGVVSWTIVAWAAVGASLGTALSYGLGVWIGPRAVESWPLNIHTEKVEQARRLFHRYGFVALLGGYFSGPLRSPVAFVAGAAGMSHRRFELANISSALVWAPFVVGEGASMGVLLPPDHPLFIAIPLLAPLVAIAVSTGTVVAWRMLCQAGRRAQP